MLEASIPLFATFALCYFVSRMLIRLRQFSATPAGLRWVHATSAAAIIALDIALND